MTDYLSYEGVDMIELYWRALSGATDMGRTFARLLMAPPSPPEDPSTGSATGAAAAYLWRDRLIDSPSFIAEQGHCFGRPGQAEVSVPGPRNPI